MSNALLGAERLKKTKEHESVCVRSTIGTWEFTERTSIPGLVGRALMAAWGNSSEEIKTN